MDLFRTEPIKFLKLPVVLCAISLAAMFKLAGCATAPTHPALKNAPLPKLLPARRYFADTGFSAGYQLSPDGQRLLWHRAVGADDGIAVGPVPASGAAPSPMAATATYATGRVPNAWSVGTAVTWLSNSRHFVYLKDFSGDENTQIFVQDSEKPRSPPVAATPWPGTRSLFVASGPVGSSKFFFQSNRRDPLANDLFAFDAVTGQSREVAQSNRDVIAWLIDMNGELGGRIRQTGATPDTDRVLELRDGGSGEYREVIRVNAFEALYVMRLDRQRGKLLAASNRGRDKVTVVETDLSDGREKVVFESPTVDVGWSVFAPGQFEPLAVRTDPDYPRMDVLNQSLNTDLIAARDEAFARGCGASHQFILASAMWTLKSSECLPTRWLTDVRANITLIAPRSNCTCSRPRATRPKSPLSRRRSHSVSKQATACRSQAISPARKAQAPSHRWWYKFTGALGCVMSGDRASSTTCSFSPIVAMR